MTEADLSNRLPTALEKASAFEAVQLLAQSMTETGVRIPISRNGESTQLQIPTALADLVLELLMHVSNGETVTLVPYGSELTTQEAANLLNVSRPFLIKLIDANKLKHHKVGRHRRIKASDLMAFKEDRDRERERGLEELTRIAQEADAL